MAAKNAVAKNWDLPVAWNGRRYSDPGKVPEDGGGEPTLLFDGFESADISAPDGPAPALNQVGFTWTADAFTPRRLFIVTQGPSGNEIVYPPASAAVVDDGQDWTARAGSYSLQIHYEATWSTSEQRFTLTTPQRELWIRFWIRVPEGYAHGTVGSTLNNKFFALWMDDYSGSGDGPTLVWEYWPSTTLGAGGSDLLVHYSEGNFTGAGTHLLRTPLWAPADEGRWMQVCIHTVAATSRTTPIGTNSTPYRTDNDGVIQMYRRWDGETEWELIHDIQTANIASPSGGPDGWRRGYLLGANNAQWGKTINFLIDNFELSTESLL